LGEERLLGEVVTQKVVLKVEADYKKYLKAMEHVKAVVFYFLLNQRIFVFQLCFKPKLF
jgi:hypothetical protein